LPAIYLHKFAVVQDPYCDLSISLLVGFFIIFEEIFPVFLPAIDGHHVKNNVILVRFPGAAYYSQVLPAGTTVQGYFKKEKS
jgi:hypothetical protein